MFNFQIFLFNIYTISFNFITTLAGQAASTAFALIGKMGSQACFLLIYSITADVYPTVLRYVVVLLFIKL